MLSHFLTLTTFSGRLPRKEYWKYIAATIAICLFQTALQIIVAHLFQTGPILMAVNIFIMAAGTVASLIVFFSALVRRLRDLSLSPYWAIAYLATTLFWPLAVLTVIVLGSIPTQPQKLAT